MRPSLVEAVEGLTERTVVTFMSANDIDPDAAAEIFVMDRARLTRPARGLGQPRRPRRHGAIGVEPSPGSATRVAATDLRATAARRCRSMAALSPCSAMRGGAGTGTCAAPAAWRPSGCA